MPMGKATLMFSSSVCLKIGFLMALESSQPSVTPMGGTMAARTLMPSGP